MLRRRRHANGRRAGKLRDRSRLGRGMPQRKKHAAAQDAFRPGAAEAAARLRGDEQGLRRATPATSRRSACRRSPARSSCTSTSRATGSTAARPARSAGRSRRRSACAPPIRTRTIVALSGDYDFQFMIEELAVGAQHKLPYIHVVVNNAYLGLIRQAQRGFEMDSACQLAFENVNAPRGRAATASTTSRSPRAWAARRSGCTSQEEFDAGDPAGANGWMKEYQVPVVIEIHPRARHQHLDGHRDRQDHRVRGARRRATKTRRPRSRCSTDQFRGEETHAASFSANLTMLFSEHDFLDRFDAAAEAGFKGVEYLVSLRLRAGGGRGRLDEATG